MSSLLSSGGGRAYRLESLDLELEIIKSPSSSWISNSSSPSSTLSESSNCPFAISTRKPRTPRKRPNQTYNEAAAILSTAYPKIFPTKHLIKSGKLKKSDVNNEDTFLFDAADLLMPFQVIDNPGFLLHRSNLAAEAKEFNPFEKTCPSPGEINSLGNSSEICDECGEDFDAESILDEEIGEGIDSIMGSLSVENESSIIPPYSHNSTSQINSFCYGYPVDFAAYGMRKELRAIRNVDEGDWWRFPSVNVGDLTRKSAKISTEKKKKKKKKKKKEVETKTVSVKMNKENLAAKSASEDPPAHPEAGLILKLNYDIILRDWSDKVFPFSGDSPVSESAGNDVQTRLAQIDLFSENGGVREASVLRYKEKRRTRLFSKKIRYQVRKVNADRRPRMKGRFVRTPDDSPSPAHK